MYGRVFNFIICICIYIVLQLVGAISQNMSKSNMGKCINQKWWARRTGTSPFASRSPFGQPGFASFATRMVRVQGSQSLESMLSAVPFGMMIPNDAQLIKLFPGPNQQVDMFLVIYGYFKLFPNLREWIILNYLMGHWWRPLPEMPRMEIFHQIRTLQGPRMWLSFGSGTTF